MHRTKIIALFFIGFLLMPSFINAMEQSIKKDNEIENSVKNHDKVKEELFKLLIEIKLIQRSCQNVKYQDFVPRRFKGMSYENLVERQKKLIPKMKELVARISDDELDEIVKKATREAIIEEEITCDVINLH